MRDGSNDAGSQPDLVMLVGSPRSGTTWLQSCFGSHPAVATPQETDLFRVYLQPLDDAWRKQLHGATDEQESRRRKGLPLVLTDEQFVEAGRALLDATLTSVQQMKPGSRIVVEKSPAHSMCTDTILRFAPSARFVHIIRDGRDVAASMMAASKDWGRRWAPSTVARAAETWKMHLTAARRAAAAPGGYCEVRYEDLLGPDGPAELRRAFAVVGIDLDLDECGALLEANSFDEMRRGGGVSDAILTGGAAGGADLARREPDGFFRRGTAGGWREEWSRADRQTFFAVAGDLLVELGYEPDAGWVGGPTRPSLARRVVHRASNSSARGLRTLADAIERAPLRRR